MPPPPSPCRTDKYIIYMGRDKFENEELLQHGLEVDVWFHVSQLSSAHVYLRLPDGVDLESIPEGKLLRAPVPAPVC